MKKEDCYIIRIDNDYVTGFDGESTGSKTSHMGWQPNFTEISEIEFSTCKSEAKVFDGKINLKSALDKIYDRLRYTDFEFEYLEVLGGVPNES